MYSTRTIQFIPVAEVQAVYNQAIRDPQNTSVEKINRAISAWFYDSDQHDVQLLYNA